MVGRGGPAVILHVQIGVQRQVWHGTARQAWVLYGSAGRAWIGMVWSGPAGKAWSGLVGCCGVRLGKAGEAGHGGV